MFKSKKQKKLGKPNIRAASDTKKLKKFPSFNDRTRNVKHLGSFLEAYREKEGERDKFLEPEAMLKHLKRRKRRAIPIAEQLLDCGFTLDGRFYYIHGNDISGEGWLQDMDTILSKAQNIPRLYIVITNLAAEVQMAFSDIKAEYDAWIGKQWSKCDDPNNALYGATVKRIEAFVAKQDRFLEYRSNLNELKSILFKLKNLLRVLDMQHNTVVAAIYHSRKSTDIFNAGAGSMVQSMSMRGSDAAIVMANEPDEELLNAFALSNNEKDE